MKDIELLLLTGSHFNPTENELERLHRTFPTIHTNLKGQTEYSICDVQKAHIIVGFPKPSFLKEARHLKWLQTPSAGIQQYSDKKIFSSPDIILTNASGTYGKQISDHVIGSIIAHNHNFFTYKEQMNHSIWQDYIPIMNIYESTILIFGYGDIGKHIAKKAKALDMHVIVVSNTMRKNEKYVDEFYTTESLDCVIHRADYLVLSSASTPHTLHIINRDRIAALPKNAYIINIARGNLIDEKALIESLQSGHLGGASLDVTEKEPLDAQSPLWTLANVLITPHSSGLSHHVPSLNFEIFYSNLLAFSHNEKMKNIVDFERKY